MKSSFRWEPPDHVHAGCDNFPQARKHPASLVSLISELHTPLIRQFILFSAWLLSLLNMVGRFIFACSFSLWYVNWLVGIDTCVRLCLEARHACWEYFLDCFPHLFFETRFMLSLKLIDLAWLTSQWVSGICLSLPIQHGGYRWPLAYLAFLGFELRFSHLSGKHINSLSCLPSPIHCFIDWMV